MTCKVNKYLDVQLDKGAFAPIREHATDAGIDLKTPTEFTIPARGSAVIDTGVHVKLPSGTCGLLVSKSGLNVNRGITTTGLIDEGFTGTIKARVYNDLEEPYTFAAGDKITQLVVLPCSYPTPAIVPSISGTEERGDEGYGSTGK